MSEEVKQLILFFWFALSLISFIMMGIDKQRAKKGKWRISEKALLISAFLFGGVGSFLGMKIFHHKTKHWYFRLLLPAFALIQAALICYLLVYCQSDGLV